MESVGDKSRYTSQVSLGRAKGSELKGFKNRLQFKKYILEGEEEEL